MQGANVIPCVVSSQQAASDPDVAIDLAIGVRPAPLGRPRTTKHRTLSRRGVIWLGQTCNLRCEFCYFIDRVTTREHPEHRFMPIEKARAICRTLVEVYGNTAVDIEGGEPTLYPQILELIRDCRGMGLTPTLISNGLVLDKSERCRQFLDAGVGAFKISVHGLGRVHDTIVRMPGAHRRQMRGLRNLQEAGIPFRFNVVLHPGVVPQLPDIARLAIATGALTVNWLGFNPHEDQAGRDGRFDLIPSFAAMRAPLTAALDLLDAAGLESNVRYVPPCMVADRHRKSIYHFQQLFYDHQEWDSLSWAWTTLPSQRTADDPLSEPVRPSSLWWWSRGSALSGLLRRVPTLARRLSIKRMANNPTARRWLYRAQRMLSVVPVDSSVRARARLYDDVARTHAARDCDCVYAPACQSCSARTICPGVYRDYIARFGTADASPIHADRTIVDPLHYIRQQDKIVSPGDEQWALPPNC